MIKSITIKLSEVLKKEFKKTCIDNDITMSNALKDYIKEYVKEK